MSVSIFQGHAENSVDEKGRVAIPAAMRAVLTPEANNSFTATLGLDGCIALYPNDRWGQVIADVAALNPFNPEARLFINDMLHWAHEVSLDKQGRIVLPKLHVREVGIADTALVKGMFDHIEVWDPDRYEAYQADRAASREEIAERVTGGIHRNVVPTAPPAR